MSWIELPEDHPTPSLVVDCVTVDRNLQRMQDYCNDHRLGLRPHTKTHKSIRMAQRQIACGAQGLTVAKVGEAEQMFAASGDLFIAYPAIGPVRLRRLEQLAQRCSELSGGRLAIGVDSKQAAQGIAHAARRAGVSIGIMVDLDVGFHRTGIESSEHAIDLCTWVANQADLEFRGLMCFPGHILPHAPKESWDHYHHAISQVVERLSQLGPKSPIAILF